MSVLVSVGVGPESAPMLRTMLAAMKLRAGKGAVYVFPSRSRVGDKKPGQHAMSRSTAEAARKRLQAPATKQQEDAEASSGFGGPEYTWQLLRRTCGTYLVNAPAIYGAASIYMAARQLGHSVQVAEKHYLGVHRGVSREARTLEAAMQIEEPMQQVIASVRSHTPTLTKPQHRAMVTS